MGISVLFALPINKNRAEDVICFTKAAKCVEIKGGIDNFE